MAQGSRRVRVLSLALRNLGANSSVVPPLPLELLLARHNPDLSAAGLSFFSSPGNLLLVP